MYVANARVSLFLCYCMDNIRYGIYGSNGIGTVLHTDRSIVVRSIRLLLYEVVMDSGYWNYGNRARVRAC
jgi:hypothetical protein